MRRYNCATVVGKYMLGHGGLSDKNFFLRDSAVLNMRDMK
jgi:hypothetical protein